MDEINIEPQTTINEPLMPTVEQRWLSLEDQAYLLHRLGINVANHYDMLKEVLLIEDTNLIDKMEEESLRFKNEIEIDIDDKIQLLFLSSTDYKVIKYRDQLDMGITPDLTIYEYHDLLKQRQAARDKIRSNHAV